MSNTKIVIRPKILCFVDYYIPGYKGGGPLRTIQNMVSELGNEFDFWIVTRDRDYLDTGPYTNLLINQWNKVSNSNVYYASPEIFTFFGVLNLLKSTQHDILYLNSFFSWSVTVLPLSLRWLGYYSRHPVILAPRGELSPGALSLKRFKKSLFLVFVRLFGLYENIYWQASSCLELNDICHEIGLSESSPDIFVAADLLHSPICEFNELNAFNQIKRPPGALRLIFLSRISPKKNLDYLLALLGNLTESIELYIYGPIEDSKYWSLCQDLINDLPKSMTVFYKGHVPHEQVKETFATCDIFIFPTLGENFGHVIYEALTAGTAVVLSDQTPWDSEGSSAVKILPLDRPDKWIELIRTLSTLDESAYEALRLSAIKYARSYLDSNSALEQNRRLLLAAVGIKNGINKK